jgi:signal peptidase I
VVLTYRKRPVFCHACGVSIDRSPFSSSSPEAKRKPWLGGLFSAIIPGLGHLYSGQARKGIKLWLMTFAVGLLAYALVLFGALFEPWIGVLGLLAWLLVWLYVLLDAVKIARQANPYRLKRYNQWYVYVGIIALPWVLAFGLRTFIVQAFKIPSGSMIPTLQIGDHIFVNKMAYGIRVGMLPEPYLVQFGKPQRGDVVVFIFPEDRTKEFIQRVIGIAGDTVEIRGKKISINGKQVDDPHAHFEVDAAQNISPVSLDDFGPIRVPGNHLFVMGDNRNRSYDSRFWGFVNLDDVKAKAFLIYWSWDGGDRWVRSERVLSLIR